MTSRAHDAAGRAGGWTAGLVLHARSQLLELLRDWWWRRGRRLGSSRPEPGQPDVRCPPTLGALCIPPRACGSQVASPHTHTASPPICLSKTSIFAVIRVARTRRFLETTALYTRVAVSTIREVKIPLERLGVNLARPIAARLTAPPAQLALEVADVFAHGAAARPTPAMSASAN